MLRLCNVRLLGSTLRQRTWLLSCRGFFLGQPAQGTAHVRICPHAFPFFLLPLVSGAVGVPMWFSLGVVFASFASLLHGKDDLLWALLVTCVARV